MPIYDQYKSNVAELVEEDPYFANTELIFALLGGIFSWEPFAEGLITHVDHPILDSSTTMI